MSATYTKFDKSKIKSKIFLSLKESKKISTGIYIGGGKFSEWDTFSEEEQQKKLKKGWFVWWQYRHLNSGKLILQKNIKHFNGIKKTL